MNDMVNGGDNDTSAKIIYVLYLAAIVVGLTGIIGLIMAYINREVAPVWLKSHYTFQIRTFWIGLLYAFIGMLTTTIFIGFIILLFTVVWLIVRCVKGLQMLDRKQAMPNVDSWLFG